MVKKKTKIITYSLYKNADYTNKNLKLEASLYGEYNQYNCLGAFAVTKELGIDEKIILKAISGFNGLKGRMEEIENNKKIKIFIDFAHKPNALESVLKSVRKMTHRNIIVVFGCAGLRDRLKRPMMGEIAGKFADYIILTAEDPRTEDVRDIISEISEGCLKAKIVQQTRGVDIKKLFKRKQKSFWRIPDRQEAINFAIRKIAQPGDFLLFTGKGHEKSMCYGQIEYPWDEKKAIMKALYDKT